MVQQSIKDSRVQRISGTKDECIVGNGDRSQGRKPCLTGLKTLSSIARYIYTPAFEASHDFRIDLFGSGNVSLRFSSLANDSFGKTATI